MNTKSLVHERISVFADGETSDEQLDIALAELRNEDGKATWELYHQIGDLLRSDEMAIPLSAGFSAAMAKRLAAEPALVAPVIPARAKKIQYASHRLAWRAGRCRCGRRIRRHAATDGCDARVACPRRRSSRGER